jgi:hypothetical protein
LRRAIRSITFAAFRRFGGSATIPLAKMHFIEQRKIATYSNAGAIKLKNNKDY